MKKILALLSIAILSIFSYISHTFACSCIQPKPPLEAVNDASIVFIGKVNSIETISKIVGIPTNQFETYINKISFQVDKTIKGDEADTMQVITPRDSATCGFDFEEGKDYIVYSNLNEDNELNVSLCSRTNLLENATEDLEILNIEGNTNIPQNNEKLNTTPTINNDIIATNTGIEKISNGKIINTEKQKNIYIGMTIGIFAIFLITFCMISMNKKD